LKAKITPWLPLASFPGSPIGVDAKSDSSDEKLGRGMGTRLDYLGTP